MVIGPNGTGKSTILCAMCLGLGGEPRLLGRASEVETFISNGKDEGEIEIELVNARGRGNNPTIRREIRRNESPKSLFFWDGKQISGKIVRERCLTEFDISVDNLCTFLPQDKVGNFSGFDSKQLLIETEKALSASQHHYHTHMELIQDQEEMKGGTNQKETLQDKLKQLQHESRRLERAKELMEERDVALQQADLLKKKIMWLQFDALIESTNAKKVAKAELKQKFVDVRSRVQPLEEDFMEAKKRCQALTGECSDYEKDIRDQQNEMERQSKKYESHDDAIEGLIQDVQALDATRAARERKVEELRHKMKQYRTEMENFPALDTLREETTQCRNDVNALKPQYEQAKREQNRLTLEYRDVEDECRQLQTKLAKLQDEKSRRKERIFRQQPQLAKIVDWLQSNRTKFRKEVVGPIMCEVTTKDHLTAAYLEQHVPNATLKSFVVQCKEDYDLLYRSIREEQGIPINITMIRDVTLVKRLYSPEKMDVLKRQHGIIGYMDECFEAPPLVLEALKSSAQIEKVLIGSERTQDSLDNRGLLEYLSQSEGENPNKLLSSCLFTCQGDKSFKYTSIISKYSGKPSVRIDTIRPAKWLAPGVSDEAKERVQAELDEVLGRRARAQPALQQAEQDLVELQNQMQVAKEKEIQARNNLNDLQKMENKMQSHATKLRDAERELDVNDDDEKEKLVGQIQKRVHHSLQALELHSECYKKMMKATVKYTGTRLMKEAAKAEEHRLDAILQDAQAEFRKVETEYVKVQADYKKSVAEVRRVKEEADREAPLVDDNGNDLPLKAELEELGVETLDEALLALDDAQQKVENIIADHNAIREFERNKAELEDVQAQLDDLNVSDERRREELNSKVRPWEQALTQSVTKVDALFGRYMAEMGCTGEVRLVKGEQTEERPHGNFKDWGIEIRVSFRENHQLQVLSARVQSGGERSVSTIMYLMALQDMLVAPFRCVDEINQGLDERNERLVFKRIVTNSTREPGTKGPTDHSGQYFLITPKLLPNLYDMEVEAMTVLFIFNGPYNVKDPRDLDVGKLLALRKRTIANTDAADDEENSPNSQLSQSHPAKKTRRGRSATQAESVKRES